MTEYAEYESKERMTTIQNARILLSRIDNLIDGSHFESNDRNRICGALYDIAVDHGKAILLLIENNLHGSASALVRPLFETYVRAAWIHYCASTNMISKFISTDKLTVTFSTMLQEIEQKKEFPDTLSRIREFGIEAMHSHTHGGMYAISRRITEDAICQAFGADEIDEIVRFASIIPFLSICGVIDMAPSEDKLRTLNSLLECLKTWCFGAE